VGAHGTGTMTVYPLPRLEVFAMELLLVLAIVVVVAMIVAKVSNGTWADTWAGSGQEASGRKFPGGPTADPSGESTTGSPPMPAIW
jgi:hypothetical protein